MMQVSHMKNRRILVIDDNESIQADFRKILCETRVAEALAADEVALFGATAKSSLAVEFEVDFAYQGADGAALARKAFRADRPYALAFVDVRMPPGWDGIETVSYLWQEDPHLLVVICTAFSDYSWDDMTDRLGLNDRLLILKKPFDSIEVRQLAHALTEKWNLARRARLKLYEVERIVNERTRELEQARDDLRTIDEQLAAACHAAEAASRSKSAFLANVSHEIRTPLTAILGFTDLISDPNQSVAEREDYLETIQRNGEYLLTIINDLGSCAQAGVRGVDYFHESG